MKNSVIIVSLFVLSLTASCAQNPKNQVVKPDKEPFSAVLLFDEMQIPWGMTFLPTGALLVTEKSGKLFLLKGNEKTIISNTPKVYTRGQGGLLDVALHI